MTKQIDALKLAQEALETSMYPQQKQLQAITAIKEALAQQALDRKAENARELGLDYEPEQEKTVCPFCSSEWVTAEQHDRKMDRLDQEPVAWRVRWPKMGGGYVWLMNDAPLMAEHGFVNEPLYATPPQRKPLTDEAIATVYWGATGQSLRPQDNVLAHNFARAIEAAHGIKGTEK